MTTDYSQLATSVNTSGMSPSINGGEPRASALQLK